MKDEKFVKASEDAYYSLNLSEFPNFHQSGNIEGMRARYYGKDAYLAQAGNFIYHVDEDTFHAVKDYDFIRQQPEWLQEVSKTLADSKIQQQASLYIGSPHSQTVISLSIQADIIRKMLEQIDKSVTEARLAGPNAVGEMYVSCKFNGEHKLISLTQNDKKSLLDLLTDERDARIKMIAARELAEPLFNSVVKEIKNNQEQTSVSTSNAMDDDHIYLTADKISAVLEKFYSLHEVDELTRFITDPSKNVEDIKALMSVIQQQRWNEQATANMEAKISQATFLFPSVTNVALLVNIEGLQMPIRLLNEKDAQMIRGLDMSKLSESDIHDKARDLAITYYAEELKMPYNDLVELANQEDSTLTKEDARTFTDLNKALEQKFPDGLTLSIPDFTVTDLFSYINYGKFRTEDFVFAGIGEQVPEWDNYLKAEITLPNKNLHQLVPAPDEYSDESYEYFINDLDNAEAFDAATTELMHRHPDLNGAKFTLYDRYLLKFMHIEGHLLDEAIAWVLQKPDISEDVLRKVLNDKEMERELLNTIVATEVNEYDRNRTAKAGMPEGLDMIQNDENLYFFEKGILGFALVDRMRGVVYKGETLSQAGQIYINDLVMNKNLERRGQHTFFMIPNIESESKAYLDTMKNKLVKVDVQKDIYGRTLYTDGIKVLNEGDMQHFQDITGRIKDARIIGINKPMVRCKIDGVQQSARELTKADIIKTGHFLDDSGAMKGFALSMAVKYFATDLYDNREQQQSKGMGR